MQRKYHLVNYTLVPYYGAPLFRKCLLKLDSKELLLQSPLAKHEGLVCLPLQKVEAFRSIKLRGNKSVKLTQQLTTSFLLF